MKEISFCLLLTNHVLIHVAAGGQYFKLQSSPLSVARYQPGIRRRSGAGCSGMAPKRAAECLGQQSTCWSPGVGDTDCPSHGLCCFNGCVNVCQGPPPERTTPRPIAKNPCSPTPCGPGTTCSPSPTGASICRCKPGLIPKPDTITGCGPECTYDPDCDTGYVCQNQRCVEKPDPCNPSPCGPGANCMVNFVGNPICRCNPGLVPKPNTITGCGPECTHDSNCKTGYVCQNQRCIEKPDPCDPSPCGPGANCMVNNYGNPICRCNPGLIPQPNTITGCGPECTRDPDCETGYVCQNQRCIEKPDPCNPSPCGPGANCMANNVGNPICRCNPGLVPKPDTITGCGPECTQDPDCETGYVCQNQRCIEKPDPCDPTPCGPGTICTPDDNGNAICNCEEGLVPKPDTVSGCGPECLRDSDCNAGFICNDQQCIEEPDPCDPSPCGPGTMCMANKFGNPICRCLGNLIPKPDTITGCGPECIQDPDCQSGYVCQQQLCVEAPDPCNPNPCGPGAECQPDQGSPGYTCKCPPGYFGNANVKCTKGECEVDNDCSQEEACKDYYCINPCQSDTCKKTDFCRVVSHAPICGFNKVELEPVQQRDLFVIGQSYGNQGPQSRSSNSGSVSSRKSSFAIGSRGRKTSGGGGGRELAVIGAAYRRKKREPSFIELKK